MEFKKSLVLFAGIPFACLSLFGNTTNEHLKTYLSPRYAIRHLPHEYSTYHDHVYTKSKNCSMKTKMQLTGFYRSSTEEAKAGEHFGGSRGQNGINIGNPFDPSGPVGFVADRARMMRKADPANLQTGVIGNASFVEEKGGIVFRPKHQQVGLRFDLHHDLCGPFENFFFQVSTPLVHIKNDLKVTICDDALGDECGKPLARFFNGSYEVTDDIFNLQSPLTKARICGAHSRMGFGDIDFNLGYKCYEKEQHHVFLKIKLTVPTGSKPNGEYLFDAVYGNGGHFGLGWQLDTGMNFECTKHATMKVMAAFMHNYLFEASEIRTPSIKGEPFSHYYLAGRVGQEEKPFFPAANVLTQSMRIKPGHQLEGLLAGSFKSSNFVIDAGYNLYWRDRESAWVKRWKDNEYALIAQPVRNAAGEFDDINAEPTTINAVNATSAEIIDKNDIDTSSVETPELISHTLFASLGYNFKLYHCPMFAGLGGSYEFGNNRTTFDTYSLWVKLGTSF